MNSLKATLLSLFGLGFAIVAGCASVEAQSPAPEVESAAVAEDPVTDAYRLDSGDEVRVTVFGEPDLSGEFEVDGQGKIQLPLIRDIDAKNKTTAELVAAIEAKLKEGYLKNPRVGAEVITYRPFYILGEVNKPGEYPYTSGLTVMNAIASAGDFTYRANKSVVLIKSVDTPVERKVKLTPNTLVRPGDTIRIRERLF